MKQLLITSILVFQFFSSTSQKLVFFNNATEIDEKRYEDIKGSCLLFDDWVPATLYDKIGNDYKDILINYNSNEANLEASDGTGKFISIRKADITSVIIHNLTKAVPEEFHFLDSLLMLRSTFSKSQTDYFIQLHKDDQRSLLLQVKSSISTTTQRPPGKIIETQRFMNTNNLILKEGEELTHFSLKKKDVKKALSKYGDISKWCKANKLKLSSYEAIVGFLKSV